MNAMPTQLENAMYGFMVSHILFTADKLGVFQALARSGQSDAASLARSLALPEETLERLLVAAVAAELLEKDGERFNIRPMLASFLDPRSPGYVGGKFSHFREVSTRTFAFLERAVAGEGPQWQRAFPEAGAGHPFEMMYADPKVTRDFLETMWSLGYEPSLDLLRRFSLAGYRHLVDLGGGPGSFALPALQLNPSLQATVFDLPAVAPCLRDKAAGLGLSARLNFVAGDFFNDDLPAADVYAMGYILSDWSRADGTRLLKKILDALEPGGLVIVLEKLFDEDRKGPFATAMLDLAMMVETWGRHYRGSDYACWLEDVGFADTQVLRSAGEKHMVVARKPR